MHKLNKQKIIEITKNFKKTLILKINNKLKTMKN